MRDVEADPGGAGPVRGAPVPLATGPACFYFEDVLLERVLDTPGMTLTRAHVALFQGLAGVPTEDPDVVPDLLPLCLSTGLGWRVPQPPLVVLAFLGIEWQVLRAARVGDTVMSRSRTVAKRPMREGGIVVEERDIIDQRGDVVQRGRFMFLVARRPPARRASPSAASA